MDRTRIIELANDRGFKLTDNKELVDTIFKGLEKRGWFCPCKPQMTLDNLCICKGLREEGHCHCGLFIRKD